MITLYQIEDGQWIGATVEVSSVDRGIPADWTDVQPPTVGDGQAAYFVGGSWIVGTPRLDNLAPIVANLCAAVDSKRERKIEGDFAYDFGDIVALNDNGEEQPAGVRNLQVSAKDQRNWQALSTLCLTLAVNGQGSTVTQMRCSDNVNVQTTAEQALACIAAMTVRSSDLVFEGSGIKAQLRAARSLADIDGVKALHTGWFDLEGQV